MGTRPISTELSHAIPINQIDPAGLEVRVKANPNQLAALARRLGLLELEGLTAEVRIAPGAGDVAVEMNGRFAATVVQACVVTLEPLKSKIEGVINRRFIKVAESRAGIKTDAEMNTAAKNAAVWVHPENDDAADVLDSDLLDVGESIAEELALAIDPYPRLPGAELRWQDPVAASVANDPKAHPFAVLKNRG